MRQFFISRCSCRPSNRLKMCEPPYSVQHPFWGQRVSAVWVDKLSLFLGIFKNIVNEETQNMKIFECPPLFS